MSKQLAIDFNSSITKAFNSCREYVQTLVYKQGVPQKSIVADMDLSPSHLSRKLSQSPHDSMRFIFDDLESFIESTGDIEPIKYLASKYLYKRSKGDLENQIAELQRQLNEVA